MLPNPEDVADLIREIASSEALPRFRDLAEEDVSRKAGGDLVTVADLAVEAQLSRRLPPLCPGSTVVGEEAVEGDPSVLGRFETEAPVWIIDPIDGTGNFAAGRPVFAIIVALARSREILQGWIYDPIGGRMAVAERGSGAYMAGRRLAVLPPAPLSDMRGTLHAGRWGAPEIAARLEGRRHLVQQQKSLRCAGQEYLRLLEGEMHFSLFTRTKPWDHAAGLLLHEEAGGMGRLLDGRRYTPLDYSGPGLLLAPDETSWKALKSGLLE